MLHHGERMRFAYLRTQAALHAVRGLYRKATRIGDIAGVERAGLYAVAAERAFLEIAYGRAHLHVRSKLGMCLQCREQQLPALGKHAASSLRCRAGSGRKRALERRELLGMVLDALRDRRHRRRRGVQLGNRQAGGLHDLIHVFLALELAALGAGELPRVDLEAHGPAGPLLRRGDGVAQKLLALCVAAILADVERQVHAHIGEVHQDGEPGLGRDLAHAPEHDLVFTRDALEGARARYIRRLIRRGGSGHGIVKLLGAMLHAVDRLGRAHRRAQTALTAGIEHVDAAVLNLDGIHRTDLHACPA